MPENSLIRQRISDDLRQRLAAPVSTLRLPLRVEHRLTLTGVHHSYERFSTLDQAFSLIVGGVISSLPGIGGEAVTRLEEELAWFEQELPYGLHVDMRTRKMDYKLFWSEKQESVAYKLFLASRGFAAHTDYFLQSQEARTQLERAFQIAEENKQSRYPWR